MTKVTLKNPKKQNIKALLKAIADEKGIANVLEQVERGTITDLGELSTIKTYLREIHKMGINPVTLSDDMQQATTPTTLVNTTDGTTMEEVMLPSLVDILKAYNQQVQEEQQHGIPVTEEILEQIDTI